MKKVAFLFIGVIGMLSLSFAQTHNITKAPLGTVYNHPTGYVPQLNSPAEVLITYSTNQAITSGNSVSCNNSGYHTINSYFRVFDLRNNFGITKDFNVTHVEVGIEMADGASPANTQPVQVRFYTLEGTMALANLHLLYSQSFTVPDQTLSIYNFVLSTPVLVPVNKVLVVEVYTPDGISPGNSFFIGSNATAVTSPSYLMAADCGISEPTNVASVGFPGMNIVMNVYGSNAVVPVPYAYIAGAFLLIAVAFIIRRRFF
jgi:hypothetical protein